MLFIPNSYIAAVPGQPLPVACPWAPADVAELLVFCGAGVCQEPRAASDPPLPLPAGFSSELPVVTLQQENTSTANNTFAGHVVLICGVTLLIH